MLQNDQTQHVQCKMFGSRLEASLVAPSLQLEEHAPLLNQQKHAFTRLATALPMRRPLLSLISAIELSLAATRLDAEGKMPAYGRWALSMLPPISSSFSVPW